MTVQPKMLLWLGAPRGRYIPRDFALSFEKRGESVSGVSAGDWQVLETGPDSGNETYWEVWNRVQDHATVTDETA